MNSINNVVIESLRLNWRTVHDHFKKPVLKSIETEKVGRGRSS